MGKQVLPISHFRNTRGLCPLNCRIWKYVLSLASKVPVPMALNKAGLGSIRDFPPANMEELRGQWCGSQNLVSIPVFRADYVPMTSFP